MPPLDRYLADGRLEIRAARDWYLGPDGFDVDRLLRSFDEKLGWALEHGFSGLRAQASEGWLESDQWRDFMAYEKRLDEAITGKPMLLLCSYPLATSSAADLLDVARVHQLALVRRQGRWEVVEAVNAELRKSNSRQAALAALAQSAIRIQNLDAILDEAAAVAARTLATDFSAVVELLPEEQQVLMRAGVGWKDGIVGHARGPAGAEGLSGYVVLSDQPLVVDDIARETRFNNLEILHDHGVTSLLGVVVRGRLRPWGTLVVQTRRPRAFGPDDVEFLQAVANILVLRIERSDAELAERREREILQAVFDNIPVMISFYDSSGRLARVNREWERTLGYTVADGQSADFLARVYPDAGDLAAVLDFIDRAERRWEDFRPRTRDGRVIDTTWVRFQLSDGSRIGFGLDITERKRAERALAESQALFARIFQASPVALGMSTVEEGRILDVNDSWLELFGYRREEVIGRTNADLRLSVDPDARPTIIRRIRAEGVIRNFEVQARRKSGEILNLVVSAVPVQLYGEAETWLSAQVDFTERKRAEAERDRLLERLEALSRRLLATQEEERRHLAVELHDQLGQVLTAAKIQLASALRTTATTAPRELEAALEGVDHALRTVHDLALDLRPSVLDDLGLPAALRWFADRFARDVSVQAHLAIDPVLALDRDLQTACFRVAQEALTNVARHARAANVWVELHAEGDELVLSIRDDGVGFDAAAATQRAIGGSSLGLLGMQERVSLLGGAFEVVSSTGGGTQVRARFPLGAETGRSE